MRGVPWTRIRVSRFILPIYLAMGTACDPCAGTASCGTTDRISYTGHIVERVTGGKPVSGAVLTFVRTGGIDLVTDSVSATSDGDGFFTISADAKTAGTVVGTLGVAPPGRPSYAVPGISMRTTRVGGDGGDLGRIVSDPYILWIAEIDSRLSKTTSPVQNASVSFQRTGGIEVALDVTAKTTDAGGRFFLSGVAKQPGTVLGVITVSAPSLPHSFDIPVAIDTRYLDDFDRDVSFLYIGP